jgi:hypothetical protein
MIARVQQESRSALDLENVFERLEVSIDDELRRETAKVQNETLTIVRDLLKTVDELKQAVGQQESSSFQRDRTIAQQQQAEILEMRKLHAENEKLHEEHRRLHREHERLHEQHKQEIEILMETRREVHEMASGRGIRAWADDHESRILNWRGEFSEQDKSLQLQMEDLRRHVEGCVAKQTDLEDMREMFEKAQRRLGETLLSQQQRLKADIRTETTAMVQNEAAVVRALDEQLWLCDQRLGQRIDQTDQSCRDVALEMDNLVRSYNELSRMHQDSMAAIKNLAQTHIRQNHSRSPERAFPGFREKFEKSSLAFVKSEACS